MTPRLGLAGPYDVVASSLVLFFLPDPAAALAGWAADSDGGRIGMTTFGTLDDGTLALDDLLVPYAPPFLRDPRTSGKEGPFSSPDATVASTCIPSILVCFWAINKLPKGPTFCQNGLGERPHPLLPWLDE